MARRLAAFAHYDAQGEIKRYVVHHLRALREHCEDLVFVSTAAPAPAELAKLDGLAGEIVLLPNVGFDFGMWKRALGRVDLAAWDELVLANSSVFGPLRSLDGAFSRMESSACDFWGMTDNHEIKWHLQSYFLVFRRAVLESDAFAGFWACVYPYRSKWQTTLSYEIGLTSCLLEAGFRGRALVSCRDLFPRGPLGHLYKDRRINPSCGHPRRLVERGMPFVKVEALRDNPCRVPLEPLRRSMRDAGFDMSLIELDRSPRGEGVGWLERCRRRARGFLDPWFEIG